MKLLLRTTTSRNAASLMLAVWLFVLASGFANACLLEASDHSGHQSSTESPHMTGHAAATAHDGEQSSKAPCLKACDEGSQALQGTNGMGSVDPGAPPLAGVIWPAPTLLSARYRSGFEALPSLSDPPERIIYSRWAL
ncbi:hypothetical protein ACSFA8_26390 [Variovorax sp. RT4R15]|uniref:hypothetical protein n=1 Tax=Variovorax sp. RT4R15 TaxID=3443737 RepID=UPI003F453DF7